MVAKLIAFALIGLYGLYLAQYIGLFNTVVSSPVWAYPMWLQLQIFGGFLMELLNEGVGSMVEHMFVFSAFIIFGGLVFTIYLYLVWDRTFARVTIWMWMSMPTILFVALAPMILLYHLFR